MSTILTGFPVDESITILGYDLCLLRILQLYTLGILISNHLMSSTILLMDQFSDFYLYEGL